MHRFILALIILTCFYSCNSIKINNNYIKTELFFGLSNGQIEITEKEWTTFRENFLNKTFEGYSEINCSGFWTNKNGEALKEKCKVIIYLNKGSKKDSINITHVINSYKSIFNQESVLKIQTYVNASF